MGRRRRLRAVASAASTRSSRRRRCRSRGRGGSRSTSSASRTARIRVEGYFAVTSNTAQFGARAELRSRLRRVRRSRGTSAFDALFRFSPFSFVIEVSASVSLEGVRRRAASASACGSSSRARRRGGRTAPARSRCCSSRSRADFDITWGEAQRHRPAADRRPAAGGRRAGQAEGWQAVLARRGAAARHPARAGGRPPARWSCTRSGVLRVSPAGGPARPDHRPGRQRRAQRRQAVQRLGRRRRAGRRSADVDEQFALAQFQDMDDAAKLSRPAFEPPARRRRARPRRRERRRRRACVTRAVRYEQIVIDTAFRGRPPVRRLHRRSCSTHFLRGNAVIALAALARRSGAADAVRRRDLGRRGGVHRGVHRRQHSVVEQTRSSPARRARASFLGGAGGRGRRRWPAPARHPGARGRGSVPDGRRSAPTRSCRGCAGASPTRSPRRTATRRSRRAREHPRRPAGDRRRRWAAARVTAGRRARRRAVRAGRRRRHRPARDRPYRAARLDHQLRAELPGVRRVLRRGLPLALHPGARRTPPARRLRPWLALVVLAEDEFTEAGQAAGPAAAHRSRVDDLALFPPADELWAWAHVHVNRSLAGAPARSSPTTWRAVLPRLDAVLAEQPRPRLLAAAVPAPARRPTPPTTPSSCPTFETGRLAGLGLDPAGRPARHPLGLGRLRRPGPEPAAASPTTTAGTSAPAPSATSSTWCGCSSRGRSTPASGERDMDVQDPGVQPARDHRPRRSAACCGSAARCRCPSSALTEEELRGGRALRELGRSPYPHPFQSGLAALVNLADDYAEHAGPDANAASGLGAGRRGRPRSADHAAAVRALARADVAGCSPTRDGSPARPRRQLGARAQPRPALPGGRRLRHAASCRRNQEEYMAAAWEQVGDVLEANRRIRARRSWPARPAAAGTRATCAPLLAADPGGRSLLTRAGARAGSLAGGATVAAPRAPPSVVTAGAHVGGDAPRRPAAVRGSCARCRSAARCAPDTLLHPDRPAARSPPPRRRRRPRPSVTVGRGRRRDGAWRRRTARLAARRSCGSLRRGCVRRPRPRADRCCWRSCRSAAVLVVALAAAVPAAAGGARPVRRRARRRRGPARADPTRSTTCRAAPTSCSPSRARPIRPTPGGRDSAEAARFKDGAARPRRHPRTASAAAAGTTPARRAVDVAAWRATTVGALDPDVTVPARVARAASHVPARLATAASSSSRRRWPTR